MSTKKSVPAALLLLTLDRIARSAAGAFTTLSTFSSSSPVVPPNSCSGIGCSRSSRSVILAVSPTGSSKEDEWPGDGASSLNFSDLQKRIDSLKTAETQAQQLADRPFVELPVIVFDALLPNQRLEGVTTDPTFSNFLRSTGVGGLFAVISLDTKQRKLRRDGTLCKLVGVNAGKLVDVIDPTSVEFQIVGLERCRVSVTGRGTSQQEGRVGRWRRGYDPDGEESKLGWGTERFVPTAEENKSSIQHEQDDEPLFLDEDLPCSKWSNTLVQVQHLDDPDVEDDTTLSLAQRVPALLEKWEALAIQEKTYENTKVVATARVRRGFPMMKVKPAALMKNVKSELGPIPPPSNPTKLALWGAALINPLPPLGVSPEVRGRIVSAPTAKRRLEILIWAIERSIQNLQGVKPL